MGNGENCLGVVIFSVVALLTYLAELGLNIYYIYYLCQYDENNILLVSLIAGFAGVPIMVVHLTSAILNLKRMSNNVTVFRVIRTVILHVLQLGFVFRHLQIMLQPNKKDAKTRVSDVCLLRIIHSFSSSLPLLIINSYYILRYNELYWLNLAVVIALLLSASWGVANFRSPCNEDVTEQVVLPLPRLFIRYIWRLCEIVSRILVLVTFALVYHYWLFLVFSSHWLCMTICVVTYVIGIRTSQSYSKCLYFVISVLIGYTSIFCCVDFTTENTKRIFIIYYAVMFLENTILTFSWVITLQGEIPLLSYSLIFVIMGCFSLSIIFTFTDMRCYYSKHSVSSVPPTNTSLNGGTHKCLDCKLDNCSKHTEKKLPCAPASVIEVNKTEKENEYSEEITREVRYLQNTRLTKPIISVSPNITVPREECKTYSNVPAPTHNNKHNQIKIVRSKSVEDEQLYTSNYNNINQSVSAKSSRTSTGYSCSDCECSCCCNSCHSYETHSVDTTSTIRNFYRSDNSLLTERCNSATDKPRHKREKQKRLNKSSEELNRDWYSDGYSTDWTLDSYKISKAAVRKTAQKLYRSSTGVNKGTQCCICELTEKPKSEYSNKTGSGKPQAKTRQTSVDSDDSNLDDSSRKQFNVNTPDISFNNQRRLESIAEDILPSDKQEKVLKQYVFPKHQVSALDVKAPWYASSDSGDSAFPQDTFTCSSPDAPVFSDGDSFASMEMII